MDTLNFLQILTGYIFNWFIYFFNWSRHSNNPTMHFTWFFFIMNIYLLSFSLTVCDIFALCKLLHMRLSELGCFWLYHLKHVLFTVIVIKNNECIKTFKNIFSFFFNILLNSFMIEDNYLLIFLCYKYIINVIY